MPRIELLDRIREVPYRWGRQNAVTGLGKRLVPDELSRVRVEWPERLEWNRGNGMLETLRKSLSGFGILSLADIPQERELVVMGRASLGVRSLRFAIDYSDYQDRINSDAVAESEVYFKWQYRKSGYGDSRILPGGYVATDSDFYKYCDPFRERFGSTRPIDVLARFGYAFQAEYRMGAVNALSLAFGSNFVGAGPKVRYSRFIREAASAKLSLHLPGNGPFTYRVIEFLGVETCMVSPPFETRLHVPIVPGVHFVEVAPDLSTLVDACRYYLANPDERRTISVAGRQLFEKHLHADHLAEYMLTEIFARLREK